MNKCLKLLITYDVADVELQKSIQKAARSCDLEGCVQTIGKDVIKVIVCGEKESVDTFIDLVNKEAAHIKDMEIEPFLKDRDYRGVFRIIE